MVLSGCLMGMIWAEGETYKSKDEAFVVAPPKNWRAVDGGKNGPLVTFVGPIDRWQVAFTVTKEKVLTGMTATDYTRESEKTLKKGLTDFKVLSRKSKTLDGEKGRDILYQHTMPASGTGPVTVTVRAYAAIYNGYAYNFVFRAPADIYEKYVKDFETMVMGLKWMRSSEEKKQEG
jgi:hypothetical protein